MKEKNVSQYMMLCYSIFRDIESGLTLTPEQASKLIEIRDKATKYAKCLEKIHPFTENI